MELQEKNSTDFTELFTGDISWFVCRRYLYKPPFNPFYRLFIYHPYRNFESFDHKNY